MTPLHPAGRIRRLFLVCAAAALMPPPPAGAAGVTSDNVPIPGGTVALARALGMIGVPDRATFVVELTRVIYDAPEGQSAASDALVAKLATHLEVVGRFQSALAAVQPAGGSIALKMASGKTDRNRLKDFLDLVGLKLREKNKTFTVEKTDNKQAADRLRVLGDFGINLAQLATRLNTGEAVRVEVPIEPVPVALPASVWSEAVFRRPVAASWLFSAIMTDRQAALLSHGLAALDDETLQFLVDHPAVVGKLYEHNAGAFAAFGGSLRIRDGRIAVPGGDPAVPLWEAVIGEKVGRADRFIRELFGGDGGRLAYLYDALAHLDSARAAFALGLSIKDNGARLDRFNSLVSAVVVGFSAWDVQARPFTRPENDPLLLLARIRVTPDGAPARPAWKLLWSRAFDGPDLPDNPARALRNVQQDGVVDAGWLAEAIVATDIKDRADRLDQIAFGQRVFGAAAEATLPDALVALRAFQRYRMLMLTLERMGVKNPAVYAAAARRASALSTLDANQGFIALGQYQGALALLARMARVRSVDAAGIDALVQSLSAIAPGDGRYAGGVARWIQQTLAPALGATNDIDASLAAVLAGPRPKSDAPTFVTWENRKYRLDLVAPELRRLTRVRDKLAGAPVQLALDIERVAEKLSAENLTLDDLETAVADLKKASAELAPPPRKREAAALLPPGVEAPKNPRGVLNKAAGEISKIGKPKDVKKAAREAEPLFEAVDALLADGLVSLAYALTLGDPDGTALLAGNVGRRHDFGFAESTGEKRLRAAWARPKQIVAPGVPWHVSGSVLGLDLALAPLALRRTSFDRISDAPVLTVSQRDTFSQTVALLNPFELVDADRDRIADAIGRGRARVAAFAGAASGFDLAAGEVGMDGWRRRAARWALAHDPQRVPSFFSLADLLRLGHPAPGGSFDAWGMSAGAVDGCVCTELQPPGGWTFAIGRRQAGLLAAHVADLNLHVVSTLRALGLPAQLAVGVLAAATEDYIDEVKPIHENDWLTLVRSARAVPKERIEDYVATLTAGGPLVPDSPSGSPQGPR